MRLRSISYIRSRLIESLADITDELLEMNLPVEILEGVIDDALFDVYRKIPSITGDLRKARIADLPITKTPW